MNNFYKIVPSMFDPIYDSFILEIKIQTSQERIAFFSSLYRWLIWRINFNVYSKKPKRLKLCFQRVGVIPHCSKYIPSSAKCIRLCLSAPSFESLQPLLGFVLLSKYTRERYSKAIKKSPSFFGRCVSWIYTDHIPNVSCFIQKTNHSLNRNTY